MPSTYAHFRFGSLLLPHMPGDVRRTILRFRQLLLGLLRLLCNTRNIAFARKKKNGFRAKDGSDRLTYDFILNLLRRIFLLREALFVLRR